MRTASTRSDATAALGDGHDPLDPALAARVRRRLAIDGAEATPAQVAAVLRSEAGGIVGDQALLRLVRAAQSEFVGAGPLAPVLADAGVTDVLVNGPESVWVDRGEGLTRTEVRFPDEAAVRRLAQRLAASAGRRLDDASPWVDATIAGGVRLHAVLPPIAVDGTCLSLRVLRRRGFTMPELESAGMMDRTCRALLSGIVAAKLAFLVSGGTGTGKTTMLSTLLGLVDPVHRIVLVDDAGELRPHHPHIVRLVARPPNVENAGTVNLRDLVRQALRMRPDRIVVGEVRGAEVVELLTALNTGHDGGCGTVHANGAGEVPARLEALGALGGLPADALHSQLAAALHVVVHLTRAASGVRVIEEVSLLTRSGRRVGVAKAWSRADGFGAAAPALAQLLGERGVTDPVVDGVRRAAAGQP